MTKSIYDQHDAAFANVSAYVVLSPAKERVASIAFKFPKDGAGRLYCYFHVFGTKMVRGYANGYGYDKKSAAAKNAVDHIEKTGLLPDYKKDLDTVEAMQKALTDGGLDWSCELENAGFTIYQAV